MYHLKDEQIDFILNDIEARGVALDDLKNNLLDHMCCIIEHEMRDQDDFLSFYEQLLPRFFKSSLKEIQDETDNLLTFKHYYAMKKTLNIAGIASVVFTITGSVFKIMHLPGAAICLILGGVFFCLLFLPLLIALKFKDDASVTDKLVFSFGLLTGMASCVGVLFKLQHWPFANVLMLSGLTSFLFIYVPVYFFSRIRRPEIRFNTLVNSVLMFACGGMLFALVNLGYSKSVKDSIYAADEFVVHNIQQTDEANQKLTVSATAKAEIQQAIQFGHALRDQLNKTRIHLLEISENMPETKAAHVSLYDLKHPEEFDMVKVHFINRNGNYNLAALEKRLQSYNSAMKAAFPNDPSYQVDDEKLQLKENPMALLLHQFHQLEYQISVNENRLLLQNQTQLATK